MELLVCIKRVPDAAVNVSVGADGNLSFSESTFVVNALDACALEMAVRLKETAGGNVAILTADDEASATPILRGCLSVGADSAYVVSGAKCESLLETTQALSQATRKLRDMPFDIVFCGAESSDISTGQVGVQLAEELGVPVVTSVVAVENIGTCLTVKQETATGYRTIEVELPCVITVAKPAYEPRYPSIKSKMAARKIPIEVISAENLSSTSSAEIERVSLTNPPQRQGGVRIQEETAVESVHRAIELMAEQKVI